jgi:ABC-type antimicrobial peptide transport system permease subunit
VALALAALAVGVVTASILSRFLVDLLFGVSTNDVLTYVAVGSVLGVVAVLAAYFPARRATRVDPMEALRAE